MDRRSFLIKGALLVPAATLPFVLHPGSVFADAPSGKEMKADAVILGGGTGGCAAALAACRNGLRVIMTEETDWIGGQLTQQAIPPDEHPWIETFGANASYRELRNRIREYYRRNYPLTESSRRNQLLNPGNGSVSRLCHEPRVSLAVLYEMLAPYLSGNKLTILLNHKAVSAVTDQDRVQSVRVRSLVSGRELDLQAPYFVDATEFGDILPMTGTEYVTGYESQKQTGEPHAPVEAQPANMQATTWCFAMDYLPGQDNTLEKPESYTTWKNYAPSLKPAWPGKLLDWAYSNPRTYEPLSNYRCDPDGETAGTSDGLWIYRRIAYKSNFVDGTYPSDISLVNWPQNDYMVGNLFDVPKEESEKNFRQAKELSLCWLYWLQTDAPRPDGKTGWPGLRLRKDLLGTDDGFAKHPYVREARRIKAEFTVCEQHIGTEARMKITGLSEEQVTAEIFKDSVGVGCYRIDLHPSTGGDNSIDISSLPFQVPLGSLIPQRIENLIPACKNLGVTHITNGCFRVHPSEWGIGEAAGMLVTHAIHTKETPRGIRNNPR